MRDLVSLADALRQMPAFIVVVAAVVFGLQLIERLA